MLLISQKVLYTSRVFRALFVFLHRSQNKGPAQWRSVFPVWRFPMSPLFAFSPSTTQSRSWKQFCLIAKSRSLLRRTPAGATRPEGWSRLRYGLVEATGPRLSYTPKSRRQHTHTSIQACAHTSNISVGKNHLHSLCPSPAKHIHALFLSCRPLRTQTLTQTRLMIEIILELAKI